MSTGKYRGCEMWENGSRPLVFTLVNNSLYAGTGEEITTFFSSFFLSLDRIRGKWINRATTIRRDPICILTWVVVCQLWRDFYLRHFNTRIEYFAGNFDIGIGNARIKINID